MRIVIRRAVWYLRYLLRAKHRRGHGIHSPFVYGLVRNVIGNAQGWVVPGDVIKVRQKHLRNSGKVEVGRYGAGSTVSKSSQRRIASIVRKSSVTPKQGALLWRLAEWYRPVNILEAGTGLGISTAFLAAGANNAHIITIEGNQQKLDFARKNTPRGTAGSLEFLLGDLDELFPAALKGLDNNRIMVFIDGDHRKKPTLEKVDAVLSRGDIKEMMIILDDIYWSEEMLAAWNHCRKDPRVSISIDLFQMGILIRRDEIAKQDFTVKFW